MDAKLKADWVKALRSGEYEQNIGGIGGWEDNPNKLCCIGVGARVMGLNAGHVGRLLTAECVQALGIGVDVGCTLYLMNDHKEKSFAKIADYIEQNL